VFLPSELVQGSKNVVHEDEITHDPGIVERCRQSKFVPMERTEVIPRDEEPIRLGMDRALGSDRVDDESQPWKKPRRK